MLLYDLIVVYILLTTSIYGLSVILWVLHAIIAPSFFKQPTELTWNSNNIQVRILTVDNHSLCKTTAEYASEYFDDIHIISETTIKNISGSTIHTVPSSFKCDATRKGRALEWARQNITCEKEYVLYLDEDTLITDFQGLPDVDICQFTETPMQSNSLLTFYTEIYRSGYQTEQRSFNLLKYPGWRCCCPHYARRYSYMGLQYNNRGYKLCMAFGKKATYFIRNSITRI